MLTKVFRASGPIVLAVLALTANPVSAQTTAAGPYYAIPSWDQKLPASTRFVVLSNWGSEAVLDRETGLVWERSLSSLTTYNYFEALIACANVAVGNRMGWRLPTQQELQSLIDTAAPTAEKLPAGHPFIGVQFNRYYWASTTFAHDPNNGYAVYFAPSPAQLASRTFNKFDTHFLWCVRGGQGAQEQ